MLPVAPFLLVMPGTAPTSLTSFNSLLETLWSLGHNAPPFPHNKQSYTESEPWSIKVSLTGRQESHYQIELEMNLRCHMNVFHITCYGIFFKQNQITGLSRSASSTLTGSTLLRSEMEILQITCYLILSIRDAKDQSMQSRCPVIIPQLHPTFSLVKLSLSACHWNEYLSPPHTQVSASSLPFRPILYRTLNVLALH